MGKRDLFVLVAAVALSTVAARAKAADDGAFATEALRAAAASGELNGVGYESVLRDEAEPFAGYDDWNSHGTGGATGFGEATFTSSNGKRARYKLDVPADIGEDKSYGLLIYLHGDGGSDYGWFYERVKQVAAKYDLIPMAVMSPTSNNNGPSWWWGADPNALFLDELLKKAVTEKYNIDRSRVVFTGASGGPTFLSGPWLRHYASQYRGGAVLFCGGLVQTRLAWRSATGFAENFEMFYYNGTADFLYDGARSAVSYYRGQGMDVQADYPAGVGHCGFSNYMDRLLDERLGMIFDGAR